MLKANCRRQPMHAVVLTDVPGFASTVNMATNKSILNSLNKIDQTMGQMEGLVAKLCGGRRPRGRKGSVAIRHCYVRVGP